MKKIEMRDVSGIVFAAFMDGHGGATVRADAARPIRHLAMLRAMRLDGWVFDYYEDTGETLYFHK